jgi:multiple sugar transport system substrate-binding protein
MSFKSLALGLLLFTLVGCSGVFPSAGGQGVNQTPSALPTSAPMPATTQLPQDTATPAGPVTLVVWVPPQFDPASGTSAGNLLKARLAEFTTRRPGVQVEVRVKAASGVGGLLDTLTTASAVAPRALPDLVALPRSVLETAALKGLLHPFDGLTTAMEDLDWYEYARQLAHLQNSTFGLPFAGDAMALAYHPSANSSPPSNWSAALKSTGPLAFAAADPQALLTLTLYQAAGGPVQDDQGRPILDAKVLAEVLTFYQEAAKNGLLPEWTAQLQTDDQVWESLKQKRANQAATWASHYLTEPMTDTTQAPLPTQSGTPFTLATGWMWALASPQPERQELSAQLAEFLTDRDFLTRWTEAAGVLPVRPSSLQTSPGSVSKLLQSRILLSARSFPPADIMSSLGPVLQQATLQVLKGESNPQAAAQAAAKSLAGP